MSHRIHYYGHAVFNLFYNLVMSDTHTITDLLRNTMADLTDRQLPWRTKDGWTSNRVESDVLVAVLENDAVHQPRHCSPGSLSLPINRCHRAGSV